MLSSVILRPFAVLGADALVARLQERRPAASPGGHATAAQHLTPALMRVQHLDRRRGRCDPVVARGGQANVGHRVRGRHLRLRFSAVTAPVVVSAVISACVISASVLAAVVLAATALPACSPSAPRESAAGPPDAQPAHEAARPPPTETRLPTATPVPAAVAVAIPRLPQGHQEAAPRRQARQGHTLRPNPPCVCAERTWRERGWEAKQQGK